ncbi:unnamed protein product [Rotaria sp. Silwood2]|nr:unnamed protein product [Rotaria sp. Silwood2]CAF2806392.1 unnamed protein product [Rotaria sp. Silwood2]
MEVDDDKIDNKDRLKQIVKDICLKFDTKLQGSNEEYKKCRDKNKISSPILLWLKYNTLTTGTREFRLNPNKIGSSNVQIRITNQLKSLMIMKKRDKKIIEFVKSNAILKTD